MVWDQVERFEEVKKTDINSLMILKNPKCKAADCPNGANWAFRYIEGILLRANGGFDRRSRRDTKGFRGVV